MSMTTPRVTVPVEDLLFYKLKDLILEQSEGEWTDEMVVRDAHHFANHIRPLLSAAPAPEGGAVDHEALAKVGYEASCNKKWEWASRGCKIGWIDAVKAIIAALATREEAPASRLVETLTGASEKVSANPKRAAAIRANWTNGEEAPAEAGALEWSRFKQMCEEKLSVALKADHGDAPFPMDASEAASYHRTRADLLGWVLDMWPTEPLDPRAQPPAREDAQPVAWVIHYAGDSNKAPLAQVTMSEEFAGMMKHQGREVIALGPITHPAPDALRVALTDLIENAVAARGCGLKNDPDGIVSSALFDTIMNARQALAALQAEQGAK